MLLSTCFCLTNENRAAIIRKKIATRQQNERQVPNWTDLFEGRRPYWKDYFDSKGEWARYIKIVGPDEMTIAFDQEIYERSVNSSRFMRNFPQAKDTFSFTGRYEL